MKKPIILTALLAFSFVTNVAFGVSFVPPTNEEIEKAVTSFKFKGQWISPRIVGAFLPFSSDYSLPLISSIDVSAATGTNRFFGKINEANNEVQCTDPEGETTSYRWIGRMKNGMHVLLVRQFGSGTLVSTDLLIFELKNRSAIDGNGKPYSQLAMDVKRLAVLGDRAVAKITLRDNTINVDSKCMKTCESKKLSLVF